MKLAFGNVLIWPLRRWALTIVLFCFQQTAMGQSEELRLQIDSLHALTGVDNPDTVRVVALRALSQKMFSIKPDTLIPICEEALKIIDARRKDASPEERLVFRRESAALLSNMAFTNYQRAQFNRAIELWLEALKINEKFGNELAMASILNNLGQAYSDLGDNESAVKSWERALIYYQNAKNQLGVARCYNNFGFVARLEGNNAAARAHYRKAMEIRTELDDAPGVAVGWNNLGYVYRIEGRYDSAIACYRRSEAIWSDLPMGEQLTIVNNNLAAAHIEKGDFAAALPFLQKADSLANTRGIRASIMNNHKFYANYYEGTGQFEKALKAHRQYVLLEDSLFNADKQKEAFRQQAAYEFLQKEAKRDAERTRELALQAEAKKRKNIILAFVISGLILSLFLAWLFWRRAKLIRKQKAVIERQSRELEMEALRAQMDPHFIFNSLNSLKYYIIRNNTNAAVDYIGKFARLVRLVLENSRQRLISLEDELEALAHYLDLEGIRVDHKFEYVIDNQIVQKGIEVPPLVLQPFVENAIWHGILGLEGKGRIVIRLFEKAGDAHIEIEDNGIGRVAAGLSKTTAGNAGSGDQNKVEKASLGIGLSKRRLRLLELLRNQHCEVKIIDLYEEGQRPKGTLVKIKIRIQHEKDPRHSD